MMLLPEKTTCESLTYAQVLLWNCFVSTYYPFEIIGGVLHRDDPFHGYANVVRYHDDNVAAKINIRNDLIVSGVLNTVPRCLLFFTFELFTDFFDYSQCTCKQLWDISVAGTSLWVFSRYVAKGYFVVLLTRETIYKVFIPSLFRGGYRVERMGRPDSISCC